MILRRLRAWLIVVAAGAAAAAALPGAARAQSELNTRFSGYFEHQYSLSRTGDDWRQIDYDRLRGELAVRTRQGSRASAAVVYQLFRGDTKLDPASFLPQGQLPGLDSLASRLTDRHYLNHAYIALVISPGLELTVGKQYLTWGSAWVFNPTELYRPKNALEPSYDREGVGALSMKLALGLLSDLQIAYVPDGTVENSGKLVRLRHHLIGFDVSALAAVKSDPAPLGREATNDRRYILGGDLTGEILGLGVWTEGTWSSRSGERWGELTVGGNYSLSDGTLFMVESYFNGRGKSDSPYSAQAWLERLSGGRLTLGRTTVFGMVSRKFGQLWQLAISTVGNPGDGSAVVIPSISYSFADNIDLLFNGVWYLGDAGDEYGFDQIGGFVRGRIYF